LQYRLVLTLLVFYPQAMPAEIAMAINIAMPFVYSNRSSSLVFFNKLLYFKIKYRLRLHSKNKIIAPKNSIIPVSCILAPCF